MLTTSLNSDRNTSTNTTDTTNTNKMSEEQQNPEQQTVKDDAPGDDLQHAESQGRDPNTEGPDHPKMTGTGAPGSHSAVFGLTPDGNKDDNTNSDSNPVKPAHSKEAEVGGEASGGGSYSKEDQGSRGVTGDGVADQMHDPKVGESAHGGDNQQAISGSGDKAGSGTSMTNPSQGSGDVRPSEPGTGEEKAGVMDKANPNTDADGDGKAGVDD